MTEQTVPIPRLSGKRPEVVAVAPGRKIDILDRPSLIKSRTFMERKVQYLQFKG